MWFEMGGIGRLTRKAVRCTRMARIPIGISGAA
jgi:hypothetical protein